jgi:hypothetical protein
VIKEYVKQQGQEEYEQLHVQQLELF